MIAARYASLLAFVQSRGDAPAPPKDRVKGSDVNDEGSAKNKSGDISLSDATVAALEAKVEEHNAAMRERKRPDWTHVRLGSLKAVWRRGAGAFSTSHRPGMTRDRWAMARVNAFLALARRGRPENPKYVSDFDLLHSKHPKYSKESRSTDCGRDDDGRFGGGNKCQVTDGVLKPETVEPHGEEPSFKDEDDDHVYHVTTAGNAESILSGGFKQSPHTIKGGFYESYSKGKVFFTEKSGLATWKSKIEDHLFHSHDDPPPIAIVRVKKSEVEHLLKPDEFGTKDAGAKAYYVDLTGKKKEGRAFCATGVGGGIKNDCSSSDGGGSGDDRVAKSFPPGSQHLRDAVDSVAPSPEAIWDRSKGRAETPSPKQIDEIAAEQGSHSGAPLTPEAEASYKSLVDEIGRQYEALTAAGLKARAWHGEGEPYGDPPGSTKPNSDRMREEVARTGEFKFFRTDSGFGTGDATPNHPMLRPTQYKTADGEPMVANDLFRVVHDMVAHVRGGYSFSTNGEYNGMLTHASTLPEAAWPALFAETFGQNAVYEKTKQYAPQNAYASRVGPEIIRSELKKRNKSSRSKKSDGDEPLGYQHLKTRPWLMKDAVSRRAIESRDSDCGRDDDGRFSSGNKCGSFKNIDVPMEDPRGRLRYGDGTQTDAARKLYQIGSSEKKLRGLVEAMGGDPAKTTVDINPPSLNISVADKDGNKLFHLDVENGRARLYPTKDLKGTDVAKVRNAAREAFPSEYADKNTSFRITVYRKADDIKKWEAENAKKIQKWEDKYKFSTLLPPHQRPKKWERSIDARYASLLAFAESRDCGQDPDGKFSKGNTCASGIAADAAKGAAAGAVLGGVSAFGKTFLPQAAASGAAAGAVAGAVKGIYDNKMRPTRVSARIEKVGMTDEKVAGLVKGLGGTRKSVASLNGRSGLTVTVRGRDGTVTHVVDITSKSVTIYPRSGRRELTDHQIDSIKKLAADSAPKQTSVVVKTNSLSYAARLAKKGFAVGAKQAGMIVATAVVSAAAPSVPDAVLGTADLVFDTHFTDSFYKSNKNAKR